jgi:hypothetical protein
VSETYQMRGGLEILEALDRASTGVEAAGRELSKLSQEFHEASEDGSDLGVGLRYETAVRDEVAFLYQNAIENGTKPPPADVREAMAERAVQTKQPELWARYHNTNARITALKMWISNLKAVISANQSIRKGEAA